MSTDFERRIQRLESRNRLLCLILSGVLACLVGTILLGAGDRSAPAMTAGEFRLVDEDGELRAVLSARDGAGILEFLDEKGKTRLGVGLRNGLPGLAVYGEKATDALAMVGVAANDTPLLLLGDDHGTTRWKADVTDGHSRMILYDSRNAARLVTDVSDDESSLMLMDEQMLPRLRARALGGDVFVMMKDEAGKRLLLAPE
jgi:hypothetical protein